MKVNQKVWVEFTSQEIFEDKSNTRGSLKFNKNCNKYKVN